MGPPAGVDDDATDLPDRFVNPVDHLSLVVGLRGAQTEAEFRCRPFGEVDDVVECLGPVDRGLRVPSVFRFGPLSSRIGNGSTPAASDVESDMGSP